MKRVLFTLTAMISLATGPSSVFGQPPNAPPTSQQIERTADRLNGQQQYLLQYKLQPGETLYWDVEHAASTKTRMAGEMEETASRSVSRKCWKVTNVDADGNMTFEHINVSVDMWQQIGDDEPISYNSKTDDQAPYEYEETAKRLGKPIAEITITPNGQVKDRKTELQEMKFGVGDISIPLPNQPISIGQRWHVPTKFEAKDEDDRPHELSARIAYELIKVTEGNAYIAFKTEILTPVESQKIKSQIMQKKTKGYIVFDLQNGRPIRKEVEWNEKVQEFAGGDSFLEYIARMTEKRVDESAREARAIGLSPLPESSNK